MSPVSISSGGVGFWPSNLFYCVLISNIAMCYEEIAMKTISVHGGWLTAASLKTTQIATSNVGTTQRILLDVYQCI